MATKTTKSRATKATKAAPAKHAVRKEICIPDTYTPITMWGYFGYEILFAIPVVGWIICIAFAFMAQNINLRNFARSKFCLLIIYVVIFCVLAGVGALATVLKAFGVI